MKRKLKVFAAALAAVTAMTCASVTACADSLKTVDGVTYRYSDSGAEKGKFTGWATAKNGTKYYYKDGVRLKNTWIKNKQGLYRCVDKKGRMVTGWAEVKMGKEGRFSWFGDNGVWDGKTYYSRYSEAEKFGNTVKIKVSRNEIINEPTERYPGGNGVSAKKAKAYVRDNTEYELEVPLAVADQLSVGDKLIIWPEVGYKDSSDRKSGFELYIPTLYSPDRFSRDYDGKTDKERMPDVTAGRLELLNRLLVLKNGKLKLDMMFNAYGLDWKYISSDDFYKEPYVFARTLWDGDRDISLTSYGLFGGFNEYDRETGKYTYRNNISEKKLKKLMTKKIAEHKEDIKNPENEDVDYMAWTSNMEHLWLDVTVTEIPELPLSGQKRKMIGPPALTLSAGEQSVQAIEGTSSWSNGYPDLGTANMSETDTVGCLHSECFEHPVSIAAGESVGLSFDPAHLPEKIGVKCWSDIYKGDYDAYNKYETVPVEDMSFTPKTGGYIYEIHASWDEYTENDVVISGDCYYTVYIVSGQR